MRASNNSSNSNEHATSLRAKRSNPALQKGSWIASSQAPRNDGIELHKGIELMAKGFASTTDMAEKKITFSEIGTDLYAFTAEGDPNSAVIVGDDGCIVFDAQATPAMAQQGDRAGAHRHRQADQICRAVALPRGARARRLRLQGAGHHRLGGNPSAGRGARPAGLGFRIRPLPAAVPGCREHSRPDLADADLRRRDVDLSRQARGAADAARRRAYLRRYRRLGAGCRGDVLRRPDRISFGLLLRRRAFARMADDAERNPRLQSQGDRAGPRRCAQGHRPPGATPSR